MRDWQKVGKCYEMLKGNLTPCFPQKIKGKLGFAMAGKDGNTQSVLFPLLERSIAKYRTNFSAKENVSFGHLSSYINPIWTVTTKDHPKNYLQHAASDFTFGFCFSLPVSPDRVSPNWGPKASIQKIDILVCIFPLTYLGKVRFLCCVKHWQIQIPKDENKSQLSWAIDSTPFPP